MKRIPLTQGKSALVNNKRYTKLVKNEWYAYFHHGTWYAVRNSPQNHHKRNTIWMHREILGLKVGDGKKSDHKNHNGLDNRDCNLRICTNSENAQNMKPRKHSSKYKGVHWHKGKISKNKRGNGFWTADICPNYKLIHLGVFKNEIKAAKAYDKKAKELFGEFACLNFPKKQRAA